MSEIANILGKFIRPKTIESVTFYCRGLTCAEYLDLSDSGALTKTSAHAFYEKIAQVGLVDWEDMISEDEEGEVIDISYSEDNKLILADQKPDVMAELGEFIYLELSILSDEEERKYKGYIRFLMYLSEDNKKAERESYQCDNCLKAGRNINRKCGLPEAHRNEILKRNNMPIEVKEEHQVLVKKNMERYKGKNKKVRPTAETDISRDEARLKLLDFTFPECPVSWIPHNVKEWSDRVYTAKNHNVPVFHGGIMDQPNKSYLISKVVNNEISAIESEKMKKEMNKNKRGK